MRVYIHFIKNSMERLLIYRADMWFKLIGRLIYLYVQIVTWKAIYGGTSVVETSSGDVSIGQMISYLVLSSVLYSLIEFDTVQLINDKIRSGEIAIDIMRSFNFMLYAFCDGFGQNIVNFLFESVPIIIVVSLFMDIKITFSITSILFIVSVLCSMLINFQLAFFMGILAFWFLVTWPLNMLVQGISKIFSGVWIPVWFFQDSIKSIGEILTFQYIYFTPISLYTQNLGFADGSQLILHQVYWIVGLFILTTALWKIGVKKLVVQGG